jgi:molybdopterin-guanine dinucleotide biosynthesis protein A
MQNRENIEIFILAGGQSRRMQSDKASLQVGESTLLDRTIKVVRSTALPFVVVSSHPEHKSDEYPVISDLVQGKGPMAGLYTAMKHTQSAWVMLIACDMPLVSHGMIATCDVVISSYGEKLHPLFACYHSRLLEEVELRLGSEKLRMHDLVLSSDCQKVSFDAEFDQGFNPFINLNTPEEYREFLKKLKM